jgi:folate-binding protein YgfZ
VLTAAAAEGAAGTGTVAFRVPRDVIEASGPDVASFLQGQVSQDVLGMEQGSSRWSLVLQPQGKVDGWVRLVKLDDERWLLDTEAGHGAALLDRLNRFKLRVKVSLEPKAWSMVALRGPGAPAVDPPEGVVVADPEWPSLPGRDLLGPDPAVPAGVPEGHADAYEVLRVRAGIPALGRELTERTIPAEAGIVDRSVSFTKGCYVGQELVARIDSRGNNTPRRLWGLRVAGAEVPSAGAGVTSDGSSVGEVTSAVRSATGNVLALAYLKRGMEPSARVEVAGEPAEVVELPFG